MIKRKTYESIMIHYNLLFLYAGCLAIILMRYKTQMEILKVTTVFRQDLYLRKGELNAFINIPFANSDDFQRFKCNAYINKYHLHVSLPNLSHAKTTLKLSSQIT